MKILPVFLICIMLFPLPALAQWQHLGSGFSAPGSSNLRRSIFSVGIIDSNNIWAMGFQSTITRTPTPSGFISRTADGGTSWMTDTVSTDPNYTNMAMFALNADTAWVSRTQLPNADKSKLFRTTDGGANWIEQTGPFNGLGNHIQQIHFFNRDIGICYGSRGGSTSASNLRIWRTTNGGASWIRIPSSQLPFIFGVELILSVSGNNHFDTKGDTLWFGTSAGRIWRTTNKGQSWNAYAAGLANISSVQFKDASNGIAISANNPLTVKTSNGGVSWTSNGSMPFGGRFVEYIPGTPNSYLAADITWQQPNLAITTNGGTSWKKFRYSYTTFIHCMDLKSVQSGYAGSFVDLPDSGGVYRWIGDFNAHSPNCYNCSQSVDLFPYVENFEGNGGIWCQDSADNFDWMINSGPTITPGTGPDRAYEGNYYLYIEASPPNSPNQTANLISPCFVLDSNCISSAWFYFSAHIFGNVNMGGLDISSSTDSGQSWSAPLWSRSGSQGNAWLNDSIDLSHLIGQDVMLRITGRTLSQIQGDVAIDNLRLHTTSKMNPNEQITQIACAGDTNGHISVQPSGGISPYTYAWSDGSDSSSIQGLGPGHYQLLISDSNGCKLETLFSLQDPPLLSVSAGDTSVNCFGDTTASLQAVGTGGSGSLQYHWSHGAMGAMVSQLGTGTYYVTVTDQNGCTAMDSAEVSEPSQVFPNFLVSDVTCHGDSNGAVAAMPIGGTPPYSVSWGGGMQGLTLNNLAPGFYNYLLVDGKNCLSTGVVRVMEPDTISIALAAKDVSCFGSTDGYLKASAMGGNGGYAFLWSTGASSDSISGLAPGTYSLVVFDSLGCTGTNSASVIQPDSLSIDHILTNESGHNQMDGSIDLTVSGGTLPYTFKWSNGSTTEDINGLEKGKYTVTVTDAYGCIKKDSFNIGTLSIEKPGSIPGFMLFPNPAKERLSIRFDLLGDDNIKVHVYDLQGKLLMQERYTHAGGRQEISLRTGHLPSGTYILRLLSRKGQARALWEKQ